MKRNTFLLFAVCCLLSAVYLWGCGGGSGSPGSTGTEDTGVMVDATVTPVYLGENTASVDAFRGDCDEDPDAVDPEDFEDHMATLNLTARLINANTSFKAGNLYIRKYTIEFRPLPDSLNAPPIQSYTGGDTIVIPAPSGSGTTTVQAPVRFVDLIRKGQYADDIMTSGGRSLNNYTAVYTFSGENEFGKKFSFITTRDFQIGPFDNCD